MIEFIKDRGETLAIIFTPDPFATEGIDFVTNDEDILQLGYMKYQENKQIQRFRQLLQISSMVLTQLFFLNFLMVILNAILF